MLGRSPLIRLSKVMLTYFIHKQDGFFPSALASINLCQERMPHL